MNIIGYNWNGTPIYGDQNGQPFTTSTDIPVTAKKSGTGTKFDVNNLVDNVPGLITALGTAFRRQETPVMNIYGDPNGSNRPGGNTMLYIGAAVVLVLILVMVKK